MAGFNDLDEVFGVSVWFCPGCKDPVVAGDLSELAKVTLCHPGKGMKPQEGQREARGQLGQAVAAGDMAQFMAEDMVNSRSGPAGRFRWQENPVASQAKGQWHLGAIADYQLNRNLEKARLLLKGTQSFMEDAAFDGNRPAFFRPEKHQANGQA